MSQSWFSLRFLSQNSFWKLSIFREHKGICSSVCEECERSFFYITGHSGNSVSRVEPVASLSHELTTWPNWKFCPGSFVPSAPPTCFTRVPFWRLASHVPITRSSRETSLNCTLLEISSHYLTHYPYIIPT